LERAISGVPGAFVLDRTSDSDHNRTVITFAGNGSAVLEAAVRAAGKAAELIDLNVQRGIHPRLGALDVLPFVPLAGSSMEDCIELAHQAGQRIWSELGIPIYFYQAAATRPERVNLEDVRRGQFEGLRDAALIDVTKAPDLGGPALHPTAGAVIVGARKILVAFNINLKTNDLNIAKAIANSVRGRNGGFPGVKALGLPLLSRGLVQVSMNITDFEKTPMDVIYAEVERLAAAHGVSVAESELIGLMPRKAVEMAFADRLKLSGFNSQFVLENRIDTFVRQ
jgi:glutamate formiminotransferase